MALAPYSVDYSNSIVYAKNKVGKQIPRIDQVMGKNCFGNFARTQKCVHIKAIFFLVLVVHDPT